MHLELRKVSLALLMSMLCLVSFAQRTIQGTIKDNTGEPLIGVSIVSGNNGGTVTDLNGDFTLNNVSDGAILKISYVGYKRQSIKVGNQTKFNIVMQSDDKTLDELVVVGYGVMKKRDLTGSISSIKSSDLEKVASANAMQAMQAKILGLDITQSSGQAGGGHHGRDPGQLEEDFRHHRRDRLDRLPDQHPGLERSGGSRPCG